MTKSRQLRPIYYLLILCFCGLILFVLAPTQSPVAGRHIGGLATKIESESGNCNHFPNLEPELHCNANGLQFTLSPDNAITEIAISNNHLITTSTAVSNFAQRITLFSTSQLTPIPASLLTTDISPLPSFIPIHPAHFDHWHEIRLDLTPISATTTSTPITPTNLLNWQSYHLTTTIPASTTLYASLLTTDMSPLPGFTNIPLSSGFNQINLTTLDPKRYAALRLQLIFTTHDKNKSPQLNQWRLNWSEPTVPYK
ncbi:MAG TPA: hypothetical protein VLL52_24240 [Anaerolineae bacterium]|nr:hypothetical protein [Anaerolineae bacterium]